MLNSALTVGKAATYLDLAEATACQLIQYEDLEGLQQAGVVSTAHLAWWEQELEVCLCLHGLPQLRPCSQAQEVSGPGRQACRTRSCGFPFVQRVPPHLAQAHKHCLFALMS